MRHEHGQSTRWLEDDEPLIFRNERQFLDAYAEAAGSLSDLDAVERCAVELVEDLSARGIDGADVTFSPRAHSERLGSWFEPMQVLRDVFASRASVSDCYLVPLVTRGCSMHECEMTLAAADTCRDRLAGIGFAGPSDRPIQQSIPALRMIKSSGIDAFPHAGEWDTPDEVRLILEELEPRRIGHGLAVARDRRLLGDVIDRKVVVEVLLTSNVGMGLVEVAREHPAIDLWEAGCTVVLGSDDPVLFGSYVDSEAALARRVWGSRGDRLVRSASAAADAIVQERRSLP